MVLCHTTLLSVELTLDLHLFKMNVETTTESKPLKLRMNNSYFYFLANLQKHTIPNKMNLCAHRERKKMNAYVNTETDSGDLIMPA